MSLVSTSSCATRSEDKDAVARPLARELQNRGVRVWIDEGEILLGDSLRRKIDEGLASSRFGLVVLSPSFFDKRWTQWELDGLARDDARRPGRYPAHPLPPNYR